MQVGDWRSWEFIKKETDGKDWIINWFFIFLGGSVTTFDYGEILISWDSGGVFESVQDSIAEESISQFFKGKISVLHSVISSSQAGYH